MKEYRNVEIHLFNDVLLSYNLYLFISVFIYAFILVFIHLFIHLFIPIFTYLFIHLFKHLFIYSYIYSCIYLYIYLYLSHFESSIQPLLCLADWLQAPPSLFTPVSRCVISLRPLLLVPGKMLLILPVFLILVLVFVHVFFSHLASTPACSSDTWHNETGGAHYHSPNMLVVLQVRRRKRMRTYKV